MTKKPVWHKGQPPSVGWWPASIARNENCLRWWDGECWSQPCYEGCTVENINKSALDKYPRPDEIEWTDRPASWPKRSRT